jgi:hypothetical protein
MWLDVFAYAPDPKDTNIREAEVRNFTIWLRDRLYGHGTPRVACRRSRNNR